MALDREDTLKKAEKLLRQGRLDGAIAEYVRVLEEYPRDWNSANALGDLYARAGQADKAAAQYARIAEHLAREGFYPKAAALYKKLLKVRPDDEATQLQLAEISATQGLLLDAKSYFTAVIARRRGRGDRAGSAELVIRLGAVDPADIEARMAAAATVAEMGDEDAAAVRYRQIYDDLEAKGRTQEALAALREAVRYSPYDREARAILARAAVASGDFEAARGYLDREIAGNDPALLAALAEIELRLGRLDESAPLLADLLRLDPSARTRLIDLAWSLAPGSHDAAFTCAAAVADDYVAARHFDEAAAVLHEFSTRIAGYIPALLKLIEICVDGGLQSTMYDAQVQLTDAYLDGGLAMEARVVAEDLIAREPWEKAHLDRFRRALVMLRVDDPDSLIAERLSGQAPFMSTDPFMDLNDPEPVAAPPQTIRAESEPATLAPEAPPADSIPQPSIPAPPQAATGSSGPPSPAAVPPAEEAVPKVPAAASTPPRPRKPKVVVETSGAEIDLTSALGGLTDNAPSGPPGPGQKARDGRFDDFRSEVTRQADHDQSAQHMTIARTYLEMGLTEEAIPALRTAAKSPGVRFEAASALGRLYRDRGEAVSAVEWLERAAEAPAPNADEGRALLYELATLLEDAGETARALAVYLELQADGSDYKDVAQRAERLAAMQSGP